jgi:hypothetical protein
MRNERLYACLFDRFWNLMIFNCGESDLFNLSRADALDQLENGRAANYEDEQTQEPWTNRWLVVIFFL